MSEVALRAFIEARLAEDEATASVCQDPARTLREVAAKRALAALILRYEAQIDFEWGCCHSVEAIGAGECPTAPPDEIVGLRLLASVWADHPDYRPDWSPGMVGAVERKDGIR